MDFADDAGREGELVAGYPTVLFSRVDDLGFGEVSCSSGGPFRGASTGGIDAVAGEGFRLTNDCPESRCTPTRSALLTGRHAIRSGTRSVPIGAPRTPGALGAGGGPSDRTRTSVTHSGAIPDKGEEGQ